MFKNIRSYFTIIVLITVACSFITYSISFNPLSLGPDIQLWVIRILLYILFGWWLVSLDDKKSVGELVGLAIVIGAVSFLCTDNRVIYHSITKLFWAKAVCFMGLGVTIIWLIYILFQSKTILGFLLMINAIVTVLTVLPYGIPRLGVFLSDGPFGSKSLNYDTSCFPFYTINAYQPFGQTDLTTFSIFLDIRTLTALFFIGYFLIKSFIDTIKIVYEDNLTDRILNTENSLIQFFQAGAYFTWKIIQRFIFFGKSFFHVFFRNIWHQIKVSIQSYIYVFLIIVSFVIPLLILNIGTNIYQYDLMSKISFPTIDQLTLLVQLLILCSVPLILVKLLKSKFSPFTIHKLQAKERPSLFLPIYITLFSVGLSSLFAFVIKKSPGNYLIFFVVVLIYAGTWGYLNYKNISRSK